MQVEHAPAQERLTDERAVGAQHDVAGRQLDGVDVLRLEHIDAQLAGRLGDGRRRKPATAPLGGVRPRDDELRRGEQLQHLRGER